MPPTAPIWKDKPGSFAGDIGASVAFSRSRWEDLGAEFSEVDDGQGEVTRIAVGELTTSIGDLEFGVLDGDGDSTFLLAPAAGAENQKLTALIVDSLVRAEALSFEDILDERSPFKEEESLAQRVAVLEQWAGETAARAESTAEPVAADIEVPAEHPSRPVRGVYVKLDPSPRVIKRHVGTVKWFDEDKGRGVISPRDGGQEIRVRLDDVIRSHKVLRKGEMVTFRYRIEPTDSGESRPWDLFNVEELSEES